MTLVRGRNFLPPVAMELSPINHESGVAELASRASPRRRPGSSPLPIPDQYEDWIPAFAGMTLVRGRNDLGLAAAELRRVQSGRDQLDRMRRFAAVSGVTPARPPARRGRGNDARNVRGLSVVLEMVRTFV